MTFSEEYRPDEEQDFEEESSYPTAFGVTFTPQVTGIALSLLGVVAAGYLLLNLVKPAYDKYLELKGQETQKQQQVDQQKSGEIDRKQLEAELKLKQSESLRTQVLSLFSNENTLDTLLLDVNNFVKARNLELVSFKPEGGITTVTDSSLGEAVNNRLKRQRFNLEVEGNFQKTQALLRDLERLQPLLLVKGLSSQLVNETFQIGITNVKANQKQIVATGKAIPQGKDNVKTTFILEAILPLTPEEVTQLAPPPGQPNPGEQPPPPKS